MNVSESLLALSTLLAAAVIVSSLRMRKSAPDRPTVLPYFSDKNPAQRIEHALHKFAFEKYVVDRFDKRSFTLFYWKGDAAGDRMFNAVFPVLEYDYSEENRVYPIALECRWTNDFEEGAIQWSTHEHIESYKEYERQNKRAVFVIIGVGGTPSCPAQLFIVPLSKIPRHMDCLTPEFLAMYRRADAQSPFSWNRQAMRLF